MIEIKPGTHWERLRDTCGYSKGEIITVKRVSDKSFICYNNDRSLNSTEFIKKFKYRPDLDTPKIANLTVGTKVRVRSDLKHGVYYNMTNGSSQFASSNMLSFSRKIVTISQASSNAYEIIEDSGNCNWTDEMFSEIITEEPTKNTLNFKVGDTVYWTDVGVKKLFGGSKRRVGELVGTIALIHHDNTQNPMLHIVTETSAYNVKSEWVTKTKPKQTKKHTTEPQVAQQEPIKSTKKEETFMSKLKNTALTTVDQNKEAAVIAAKMEAGRVINKQVIKHAAKHVPFWAKGYLDTPLAPVVLANAVAMLGNHTGNPKVQKVAELMLLAAADVTVQSFNLDKIIDDVLSDIKLPAGIFDATE